MIRRKPRRKGKVVVLTAFLMVGMMGFLAFTVDLGVAITAQTELQRTADATSLAAAWELSNPDAVVGNNNNSVVESNIRTVASQFAAANQVMGTPIGLSQSNVELGYIADPYDSSSPFLTSYGTNDPNAVRIHVERTSANNGVVPLHFARVLGHDSISLQAESVAALTRQIQGIRVPPNGGNVNMLPFALDRQTWDDMMNGYGTDNWTWDSESKTVVPGGDGILEVNLYPQGTGSPGNRGTVDIGSNNNSTNDIARQITDGISPSDLAYHGGELKFDSNGELTLNADTGISAGVKDELESIKGEPRMIPLFSQIQGNGNNANYTINKFAGIRIMEVKLTGPMSGKRVIVQPANVTVNGGIPGPASYEQGDYVYTPVRIVR